MKNLVAKTMTCLVVVLAGAAGADPIIFDRGLPTANLNNASGANRSNVAWGDVDPYLVGDTFNLSGTSAYTIDDFTVWYINSTTYPVDEATANFSLYVGSSTAAPLTDVSTSWTTSTVQYQGGLDYQGTSGSFLTITQLTFTNLGLTVSGNTNYYFTVAALDSSSNLIAPLFLHSSNAPLSGSTQQGANGLFSGFLYNNGAVTWDYDWNSAGGGWDKSSDVNVQITGAVVPVPAAAGLGFLGMGLVGLLRRRKNTAA